MLGQRQHTDQRIYLWKNNTLVERQHNEKDIILMQRHYSVADAEHGHKDT